MGDAKFTLEDLEGRTYRDLQQLAKSLCLPSNVKKIYLIQLIHAKKFRSPEEVDAIVHRVKLERRQMAQARKRLTKRKMHLQGAEISSTSNSQSPPISHTPKRPGHIIVPCPEVHHTVKYPRQNIMRATYIKKTYPSPVPTSSDRVLRSFSLKPKQPPNSVLNVFKSQESLSEARMDIMDQERVYPKRNVMTTCMVMKQRPQMQSNTASLLERLRGQMFPMPRMNSYPMPARRHRILSGIYPITTKVTKEVPKINYEYIQSIGFRRSDGKISHINALVQKTSNEPRNLEITVQDLINSNIDSQTANPTVPSLEYPNMTSVTDYGLNYQKQSNQFEAPDRSCVDPGMSSVYYHKKIRAEQVRSQRKTSMDREDERLPKINEVFSKFNDVHGRGDVTQPIYVQVSHESERMLNYPLYAGRANSTHMLESFYNFKNSFLVNQPLLQIATTTSTKCVYSTPIIASACFSQEVQTPCIDETTLAHSVIDILEKITRLPCERDSQISIDSEMDPRVYDFFKMADQEHPSRRDYRTEHVDEFNTSNSSLERSQEVGSSATIPEMVEDALEIISQDGDYMERIGMDVRVQCILCSWAGPRFILEYHIRKDHASLVLKSEASEWHVSFPLGSVMRSQFWSSRVVAHQAALYVLSVKCDNLDCFVALSTLSSERPQTGYITVYNKLTGEPHTWSGEIQPLSPNLPYYTDASCLKLDMSALDLIPNSANIKLVNRELVTKSPNRVIVGRPDLDDIHITVFVKILDSV